MSTRRSERYPMVRAFVDALTELESEVIQINFDDEPKPTPDATRFVGVPKRKALEWNDVPMVSNDIKRISVAPAVWLGIVCSMV